VIVDEAHLLHNRLLEELRIALHLLHNGEMMVRLILSGQLELEERLVKKDLAAINQRIVCHVSLSSLTLAESQVYLQERIEWAGGDLVAIFEPAAVRMICQASDGNPRCLNQLADQSLLLAASENAACVMPDHVLEALEQLKQLPLQWNHVTIQEPKASPSSQVVEIVCPKECEADEADEPETASFEWGADDVEETAGPTHPTAKAASLELGVEDEISDEAEVEICWDEEDEDILLETSEVVMMESDSALGESLDEVILVKAPHATPTTWDQDLWATTDQSGFVEERVIDPLAMLDKGVTPKPAPRPEKDWDAFDPVEELRAEEDNYAVPLPSSEWPDFTIIYSLPEPGEEWQPEDLNPSLRRPLGYDPSELIDRVMPLIEAALSEDCPEFILETSGLAEDLDSLPVMVDCLLPWQDQADLGKPCAYYLSPRSEDGLELEIAQTVLDTHTNVQPLLWNSTTESLAEPKPEPPPRSATEEPIRDPGDSAPFEELKHNLRKAVEAVSQSAAIEAIPPKPKPEPPAARPAKVEYDIVMPEADDDDEPSSKDPISRTDAPAPGTIENHAARKSYSNLFSKVRQKKQA
jgi:hypothetical protein